MGLKTFLKVIPIYLFYKLDCSGTINENPSRTFFKLSIRHTCIILVQTKILYFAV